MPDSNSRLVYSTDGTGGAGTGRVRHEPPRPAQARPVQVRPAAPVPDDGYLRIRREKAGRGGKTVTTVAGFRGTAAEVAELLKVLKQACGAGGSLDSGVIEIQGDHRERVRAKLETLGHKVKLAGG